MVRGTRKEREPVKERERERADGALVHLLEGNKGVTLKKEFTYVY